MLHQRLSTLTFLVTLGLISCTSQVKGSPVAQLLQPSYDPANLSNNALLRRATSEIVSENLLDIRDECPNPLQVSTPFGQVAGASVADGKAQRFTLPYAQPPVGPLRFANPQNVVSFGAAASVYDASKLPARCYQYSDDPRGGTEPSEDCLYSVVYKPTGAKSGDNLPIVVRLQSIARHDELC